MPFYSYGSIILGCEPNFPPLPLRLIQKSDKATIRLSLDSEPAGLPDIVDVATPCDVQSLSDSNEKWLLRFPEQCDFLIEGNGSRVTLHPYPGIANSDLVHLLLDHAIPRLLDHQGDLVLHAGAVLSNRKVVAFVGESGAGKSTLSSYFHLRGGQLLTDDGLIIQADNHTSLAIPTYETLRLWPDSYRRLFDASSINPVRNAGGGKLNPVINEGDSSVHMPRPLAAIFLLSREQASTVSIWPVDPADACMAIIANSFQLDSSDLRRAAQRLKQAAHLSRHTPVFKLEYPRDYAVLDEVHAAVMDAIRA